MTTPWTRQPTGEHGGSPLARIPVADKIASEQTQRVMVNLHDWRGDLTALQKQFDDWPIPGLKELVAVTRSRAIIQILRRD